MEKRKVTGIWKRESKQGTEYFASTPLTQEQIDELRPNERLMIFENRYKDNERQPDYILYAVPASE